MDRIEIARSGNKVAVAICRSSGRFPRVRYIRPEDAFSMGLLLVSEPIEEAVNLDASAGVSIQIENRPYDRAWLSIDETDGGPKLVACLEGGVIRKVGRCLDRISRPLMSACRSRARANSFLVSYCYLEEA